jgi:hypothetical protein
MQQFIHSMEEISKLQQHLVDLNNTSDFFSLYLESCPDDHEKTRALVLFADFYHHANEFVCAVEYYLQALDCMRKMEYHDNNATPIQNQLIIALNAGCITNNKPLAVSLREKIIEILGEYPDDFVNLMKHEKHELVEQITREKKNRMDEVSQKHIGKINIFGHTNKPSVLKETPSIPEINNTPFSKL